MEMVIRSERYVCLWREEGEADDRQHERRREMKRGKREREREKER